MGPDLVHTTSLKASVYGTIAARAVRLPLLWHLHDRLAADYLPPAVVPPMRLFAATARARPSRRLDSPYESSAKGQHVFLEAFATAFPEGSLRARLIGSATFGEADYGRALREQAERLGIADRVDFVGFNPDVLGELERADLPGPRIGSLRSPQYVSPRGNRSRRPGGRDGHGGHVEYMSDGREGVLHRPGRTRALAGVLRRAAGDPELRRRIAAGARERARELAPAPVAQRWTTLYRALSGGRRMG